MGWAKTDEDLVARCSMIERQIRARGVLDARVLGAMGAVPRELFVAEELRKRAYDDTPLPIGHGQTISQPYMVALMLECAAPQSHERVLDVGTGSGYQAALLSRLAREVYTIERIPELAHKARERLNALAFPGVVVVTGDGTMGLEEHAPYDAILVSAGAPYLPDALTHQLAEGGRLVIPIGHLDGQKLVRFVRRGRRILDTVCLECAFVPLVGEDGWSEEQAEGRLH